MSSIRVKRAGAMLMGVSLVLSLPHAAGAEVQEVSISKGYGILYLLAKPVFPLLKLLLPNYITTTEHLGRAMIRVAQNGSPKRIFEARDINQA